MCADTSWHQIRARAGPDMVSLTHKQTKKNTQTSHDNAYSHSLRPSISFVDHFPSLFPLEWSGEQVALSS